MIVFIVGNETLITPIAIYFKSEQHDISAKDAEYHLAMTMSEIKRRGLYKAESFVFLEFARAIASL